MFRVNLLRNLLILSLCITVLMPGYIFFVVHPAYRQLLTEETETEAVRYASYMVRTLNLENRFLTPDNLPAELDIMLEPARNDTHLVKLRIFSSRGEIIFSTLQEEVGDINRQDYFREIVARGKVYSKVVQKDQVTADGDITLRDVVETYVPFMADGMFGGAVEVYYDITESVHKVRALSWKTFVSALVMAAVFMAAILLALRRAAVSLKLRDKAEASLLEANNELERRVAARTEELSLANEQLSEQIAERTVAQKALGEALKEIRADREKLAGILSSVPDGVLVTDSQLNVLHINPAAEELLGRTLAEVEGQPLRRISEEVDFLRKVSQRLNVSAVDQTFDFELSGEDPKTPRVYQARISQYVPGTTESQGVVLLICDVTREREVERMKSAFLGMAAHELNTPLTTIIGYSELLTTAETAEKFDADQQRECLMLIHDKALALGRLVDDLLDISRIESGRPLSIDYRDFDLLSLIHEILSPYLAASGRHRFELHLPEGEMTVSADRGRLAQLLGHLVGNAVKYSPGGGRIGLTVIKRERDFEIHVEDEGIGMTEEQAAHVFDRFYRVDSTNTAVQGAGLGLSIVRHVVDAHHGDVQVESRLGQGTVIRVILPLLPPTGNA